MAPKISAGSLFKNHYLVVKADRVLFYESTVGFGARRFRFVLIDCVLMAPDHTLSFQVGKEVFSIPTRPDKPRHQAAIAALVAGVQQTISEAQARLVRQSHSP
jgi:hypothetical protein